MALNDILSRYHPTGASEVTALQDGHSAGVAASQKMAQADLIRLQKYRADFIAMGEKHELPPALLAAIASRESRGGKALVNGYGDGGNGFGLMQVDKRSHAPRGGPYSREHIDQAAGILRTALLGVVQNHSTWTREQQLRGGVVAYNSGVKNVRTLDAMDEGTTGDDYSNDTWARAQFLAPHFGGAAKNSSAPSPQPQPSSPVASAPGTRPGQTAAQGQPVVRELQQLLIKYGYMSEQQVQTGPGILGPKTRSALSRFLTDKSRPRTSTSPSAAPPSLPVGHTPARSVPVAQVEGLDPRHKFSAIHPVLAERVNAMAAALLARNIPIIITDGLRTFAEQDALYAKGRIAPHKDEDIVTKAKGGQSNHNYGLAVDVVPLVNGKAKWDVSNNTWNIIGEEGVRAGLEWGGTWTTIVDRPHFQLPVDMSVAQCLSIYQKGGISAVWAEADRKLQKTT